MKEQTPPTTPLEKPESLKAEDVLTSEAMELWRGNRYGVIPESRIIRCGQVRRTLMGTDAKIDAAALEEIFLDYLQEYPIASDGWKLVCEEFRHIPKWVWGNYAVHVLGRQMDIKDVESFVRPDDLAATEETCRLCGRRFVPRSFQMIGKEGNPLLTKEGQPITHGNYFVAFYDGKLAVIPVCGFPPLRHGFPQCYRAAMETTAWKGSPQLGHTKANAEAILKRRLAAMAERAEQLAAFNRLGKRPVNNDDRGGLDSRTAEERIFGRDRRNENQGGYGDRGPKRRFQQ